MEWEDLGRSDVGHSDDFRTSHRCVIILRSAIHDCPPLNLIIATCLMLRHLRTLEKPDDPRTQLALSNLEQAVGKLICRIRLYLDGQLVC